MLEYKHMFNESRRFETIKNNESVFGAEEFGFNNRESHKVKEEVAAKSINNAVDDNTARVDEEILTETQVSSVNNQNDYVESAKLALDADGSSRTKEIGPEFKKLVMRAMAEGSDDPAKLNDDYDALSRQAIHGMFGREIGGGK